MFQSRDEAWGNIEAGVDNLDIVEDNGGFRVLFDLEISNSVQQMTAAARVEGGPDGRLRFSVTATAVTDFRTNRTGLLVLHPLEHVVGQPVDVVHTDGTAEQLRFPELISPGQPIFNIRSLTHEAAPGLRATVLLEGAKFEMEDHRNWMDASFKTYSGSLLDAWPYTIARGETVTQSVTLTAAGRATTPSTISGNSTAVVTLGEPAGRLPEFGTALPLADPASALEVLDALDQASPAFLVGRIDGQQSELDRQVAGLAEVSRRTNLPLQLELILSARKSADEEVTEIAAALDRAGVAPSAVIVTQAHDMKSFQPGDPRPAGPGYAEMASAARSAFPGLPIGGGVVAFFTELNRLPVPRGLYDFVTHSVCPAVHAADDLTLMENLEAARWIFASARTMIGGTPYHLGPSWVSSRVNPYGLSVTPNPEDERVCLAQSDPRQRGVFGAAWLLGLAAAAAEAGLASVCLASLCGPQGLAFGSEDRKPPGYPGAGVTPAFHVLKGLAAHRTCHRLAATCNAPSALSVLGIRTGDGDELWVANLTGSGQQLQVEGWHGPAELLRIDQESFEASLQADFLSRPGERIERVDCLSLRPYATARLATPSS